MTDVTREQFETISDVEVVHRPTGARFSTYRYDEPTAENIAGGHWVNWGNAGNVLPDGADYERSEIQRVAIELLAERGRKPASS